jgi:hypothetical protein
VWLVAIRDVASLQQGGYSPALEYLLALLLVDLSQNQVTERGTFGVG